MSVHSDVDETVVGRSRDWVEIFSGEEATAGLIRARLDGLEIPARLDQPIIGSGKLVFSVIVRERYVEEARRAIADLAPRAAATSRAPDRSETTRLLCGTVLLNAGYRRQFLDLFDDPVRAIAPELGVDFGLVAGVARAAERRDSNFQVAIAATSVALTIIGAVLRLMSSPLLVPFGIFVVLLCAVLLFRNTSARRWRYPQLFTRENFDPAKVRAEFGAPDAADKRLPRTDQNVVVYGGFTPFVGAGIETGGWSTAVDTSKVKDEPGVTATIPYVTKDIYDAVLDEIKGLGLPQVEVRDFVYLSGTDIRNDREILPDILRRPVQSVDPKYIDRLRASTRGHHARWYPWIRIYDWDNEVVISQFLRFHEEGKYLFIELKRYVLPPPHAGFRGIDRLAPRRVGEVFSLAFGALIGGWMILPISVLVLLWRVQRAMTRDSELKNRRKMIEENPAYNYGATTSIRESATNGYYSHYFQQADANMINQMLEGEVLNTIVEFLDAHNIDTSDIKERRTTILNNGIIGNVSAETLAVGQQSSATKNVEKKKPTLAGVGKKSATAPGVSV